eukprot:823185_1
MALPRAVRLTTRHLIKASKFASIRQLQPSSIYLSNRLKTYLVGVDGSGYGFSALKSTAENAHNGDEIICMYFPPNLELMMVQPTTIAVVGKEIYDAQREHTTKIEEQCKQIMQNYGPKDKDLRFEMHIGDHSFSPKDDLIAECYKTKADALVLGEKGIAHSFREKVTEKLSRTGQ